MKKQVAVIGMGRFGISIASTLRDIGHDVLVLDINESKVQAMAQVVTHAIQGDATNETILNELGIGNFDVAVVAIGTDIRNSVLSTILLKKLGVQRVIARANDELHGAILERIGANSVVYPEREMGTRVAQTVTLSDVLDYMPLVPGYGIAKLTAPPFIMGENLADLGFGQKGKWGIAVLLIQRADEVIVTPAQAETIRPGDVLILAGENDKLNKLLAEAEEHKGEL